MRRPFAISGVVAALAAAGAIVQGQPTGRPAPAWNTPPGVDFPLVGGNYSNQRYSTLDQITTANIGQLGAVWSLQIEERGRGARLEGTPVVVDGVMYVTTSTQHVIAIDARNGQVKWRYHPDPPLAQNGPNRGVVVAGDKILYGRRDNLLMALDKSSGRVLWQTPLSPQRTAYSSAAPVYYDGLVFIGLAGGDYGARGQITAYDVNSGARVWGFNTIPGPGDRFANTWEDEAHKSGGGVWNHVAVDPELGMLYAGVGNAGPNTDGAARGGDNLLTASIVAVDLRTGAYKWHFQEVHHDVWDYDAGSPPVLADITFRGRPRKVLIHAGKTGFLYILDRVTGKPLIGITEKPVPQEPRLKTARTQPYPVGDSFVPLCAEKIGGYLSNCLFTPFWETPVLIAPGSSGGNGSAPSTYSPKTGLVYVPANAISSVYSSLHEEIDPTTGALKRIGGGEGIGRPAGVRRAGTLTALDPKTNRIVWQHSTTFPMGHGSGLLSTAGGLLFHGESDGRLIAYDIRNGTEVWSFQTGGGANAPVATFSVDGEQYVSVLSGGNDLLMSTAPRGHFVWTFKLGGKQPEVPPPPAPPATQP